MIDEEVGDLISQLKVWMKDEDRTEAYLAKKLGISKQRLNGWMLGTSRPNLEASSKSRSFYGKTGWERNDTGRNDRLIRSNSVPALHDCDREWRAVSCSSR